MGKKYVLPGGREIEDFVPHHFGGPALREFFAERRGAWWDGSITADVRNIPGLAHSRYKRIFHSLYYTDGYPAVEALRDILELHSPRGGDRFSKPRCDACFAGIWPCDTFLAIERAHDAALSNHDPDDDHPVDEDFRE